MCSNIEETFQLSFKAQDTPESHRCHGGEGEDPGTFWEVLVERLITITPRELLSFLAP